MYNKIRSLGTVCIILGFLLILALTSTANAAPTRADRGPWAPNTAYAVNDTVTYGGCAYKVLQAHTSMTGWEPPNVPALFQQLSCGGSPSNTPYPTGTMTKTNTPSGPINTSTRTATKTNTVSGPTYTPYPTGTMSRTNTPAGATPTPSRTPSKTPTPVNPTSAPTSSGGTGCTTPWSATATYTLGNTASDNNRNYKANWWNQNDRPSTSTSGVWSDQGACAAPTPGPTTQPGGGLPSRVAAIYTDISFTSIQAAYQATGTKYYAVAFALANAGACSPAWDGSHPMSENYYSSQINAIRAGGGDVIGVFGGASGWDIATTCTSVSSLQAAYQTVINQYQFKWIDLNIEGGLVSDSASYDRRNKAIAALEAANPNLKVSYTLPVMQTGLLQTALDLLSNAKTNGVRIDYVNVMTMNYGPSGIDMGQAAISAATNTHNQLAGLGISAQIGITPMNGQNNTSGEIFTLANADAVVAFARANSYVGWLSFWSLGRDNGGCAGNTTASASCSGITQNNYDFTNKFKLFP
jgi:chitinase